MRINLISDPDENSCLENISSPNHVYAWFLRKALVEEGVDAKLVNGWKLLKETPPETDHTIVVSAGAYGYIQAVEGYTQKLESSTKGKLTCYMNTNKLGRGSRCFDYCFTQIGPVSYRPEKYVCVGWGVDPNYSYPEQDEKAAFLDSKDLRPRKIKKIRRVYQTYDDVLSKLDMKIHNPIPVYNDGKRLSYPNYQAILRKCHYFLCTQFGDGGLNRLEAAACGALLVVPQILYRRRTMSLLNHQVWSTEEELVNILHENVDIEANRQRALEHRWENVAKRIIEVLKK